PNALPSHLVHLAQHLLSLYPNFVYFKYYHAEAVEAAIRTDCDNFDKVEFLDKIDIIREQTFKTSTIQSAFRVTGLIPYNLDVVISKL
ncbi:hypothetical protein L873DRAFT_1633008, partial [Choiromyces venosus 120613-1]